jgi:hypothetical protein
MSRIRSALSPLALLVAFPALLGAQAPATVRGTVMDSVRRVPLAGATVILLRTGPERAGESFTAISGRRGEFSVDVPAGRYGLTAEHPSLDSMDDAVVPLALDLAAGSRSEVVLATASPATLKARACPGLPLDSLTGAVLGRVQEARVGGPVAGATVLVQWDELQAVPTLGAINTLTHTVEVKADDAGLFAACGVPLQVALRAQVQWGNTESGVVDLMISPRGVLARAFRIDTVAADARREPSHVVVGSITAPDGAPVPRARVRIAGDTLEATTDEHGSFRLRTSFAGTQTLEAVAIGYTPGTATVDVGPTHVPVVNLQLEKFVVVLEAMRTVAKRASGALAHKEFESRRKSGRGIYITPEMLAARNPFQLSDLLRDLPGGGSIGSRARWLSIRRLSTLVATPAGMAADGTDLGPAQRPPAGMPEMNVARPSPSGWSAAECPEVFVNDVRDNSGLGINALPPDWVYGVEIYRRGDASPPRIHNWCGLILIWTK